MDSEAEFLPWSIQYSTVPPSLTAPWKWGLVSGFIIFFELLFLRAESSEAAGEDSQWCEEISDAANRCEADS